LVRAVASLFVVALGGFHRDLDCFPTRRSSDLLLIPISGSTALVLLTNVQRLRISGGEGQLKTTALVLTNSSIYAKSLVLMPMCRSEEHTSELQSRENLVCRLVPEKKQSA